MTTKEARNDKIPREELFDRRRRHSRAHGIVSTLWIGTRRPEPLSGVLATTPSRRSNLTRTRLNYGRNAMKITLQFVNTDTGVKESFEREVTPQEEQNLRDNPYALLNAIAKARAEAATPPA